MRNYIIYLLIGLLVVALALAGCGGGNNSSSAATQNPTIVNSIVETGSIAVKLNWGSLPKAISKTVASAPAGVVTMRIIVYGSGITSAIQKDFIATAGTGTIDGVPSGTGRTLTIQGLDISGTVTWQGSTSNITVKAGQTTDAGTITVTAATSLKIEIVPASISIETGSSDTILTAFVSGTTNTNVAWSVVETGGGAITSAGKYTAPYHIGNYTVKATSNADPNKFATANISVTPSPTPPGYNVNSIKPGTNFDFLSTWQIELPGAQVIPVDSLNLPSSYQDRFFYTDTSDTYNGGKNITFWVPPIGTPLDKSNNCRSEMREIYNRNYQGGWSYGLGKTNKMTVTGKVVMMSPNSHTVIGQINQYSVDTTIKYKPIIQLLYYDNGEIKSNVLKNPDGSGGTIEYITKVNLGSIYTYSLDLSNGGPIRMTITTNATNESITKEISIPTPAISQQWSSTMFFKAGNYDQSSTSGALQKQYTGTGSIVKIYSLDVVHK